MAKPTKPDETTSAAPPELTDEQAAQLREVADASIDAGLSIDEQIAALTTALEAITGAPLTDEQTTELRSNLVAHHDRLEREALMERHAIEHDPSRVIYPINVMIGEGTERTHVDGVEYAVDPETGRIVCRADDPAAPPVTPEPEPDEADADPA